MDAHRAGGKLVLNGVEWDGMWKDMTDAFTLAGTGNFYDVV